MAYEVDQIVTLASARVEKRVEGELDLRLEFFQMLSEFCRESRFWWLQKTATFNTVVGTATYDLSASAGANATDVDEIIRVYRVDSASSLIEVIPIVEIGEQAKALEATTNGDVASYFMEPGKWQTLRLGAPANTASKIRFMYWAGLNPAFDATDMTVPLVPGTLHYGLVTALEFRLLSYLYGQNDPRTLLAAQRYKKFVADAGRRPDFTTAGQRAFSAGDAVRAAG